VQIKETALGIFLLQPLVELDQSCVVYQLSMINQTLCVSEGFFPGGRVVDFYRGRQGFFKERKKW